MFKFFINCFYCVPSILERLIHKKRIFQLKGITFIILFSFCCITLNILIYYVIPSPSSIVSKCLSLCLCFFTVAIRFFAKMNRSRMPSNHMQRETFRVIILIIL